MSIRHTIISWDCSFRNFFHLIDAVLVQDYDLARVEVIYVEQRSKAHADDYNHRLGLKSLSDRKRELSGQLNLRVEYLDDPPHVPYHLGRTVNKALRMARGDLVSVMDGDILVPPDFLVRLDSAHEERPTVVNLLRLMAERPVGAGYETWTDGVVDYEACKQVCPPTPEPYPLMVPNKGPMVSAPRQAWDAVLGYDEHRIWSTGLTRLGQDVTARLEFHVGHRSVALQGCPAVHPYHPAGFSRTTLDSARLLTYQADLISWAMANGAVNWQLRTAQCDRVVQRRAALVGRVHGTGNASGVAAHLGQSEILGRLYARYSRLRRLIPLGWRIS